MSVAEMTTQDVIARMLKENTGAHFLDSGGAYGRHWERNQYREFESEPESVVNFRWGIELTHNVYHWLKDRLDYDETLHNMYLEWVENNSDRYTSHYEDMHNFVEYLKTLQYGYADEGDDVNYSPYAIEDPNEVYGENSYNGPDLLSQTIQYTRWIAADGEEYCFLQIHQGCDVRGGYTDPVPFRVMSEHALAFTGDGSIYCDEGHNWRTDDAYHYYPDGTCGRGYTQLQEYDEVKIDTEAEWIYPTLEYEDVVELYEFMGWDHSDILPVEPQRGKLSVDQDGNGYCPKCGGLLKGGFY